MLQPHRGYFNRNAVENLIKAFAAKHKYDNGKNTENGIYVLNVIDNTERSSGELIIELRENGFWIEREEIENAAEVTGILAEWAADGRKLAEIMEALRIFSRDYDFDRIVQQDPKLILFWVRWQELTLVIAVQKLNGKIKLSHQDTRDGEITPIQQQAVESNLRDVETVINNVGND